MKFPSPPARSNLQSTVHCVHKLGIVTDISQDSSTTPQPGCARDSSTGDVEAMPTDS